MPAKELSFDEFVYKFVNFILTYVISIEKQKDLQIEEFP